MPVDSHGLVRTTHPVHLSPHILYQQTFKKVRNVFDQSASHAGAINFLMIDCHLGWTITKNRAEPISTNFCIRVGGTQGQVMGTKKKKITLSPLWWGGGRGGDNLPMLPKGADVSRRTYMISIICLATLAWAENLIGRDGINFVHALLNRRILEVTTRGFVFYIVHVDNNSIETKQRF